MAWDFPVTTLVLLAAVRAQGQRLRVTNGCGTEPIWIAHMASNAVGPDEQNVRLEPGESTTFATTPGLSGTRYWPKMRCNSGGNECLLGESGGPGESCDLEIGCAPPVDTKFEASFGSDNSSDWVDVSLVDGWTLPFKFEMSQSCAAGDGNHSIGAEVDCSALSFEECPSAEDVGAASTLPLSLEVRHPTTHGVVGCYAPCSKLTFNNWDNPAAKYAPTDPPVVEYCCPTPPESPQQCRDGPVKGSLFVKAVHRSCPGVYGYSYDDGMGLITCPANTTYNMTFYCPKDLAQVFPQESITSHASAMQRAPGPAPRGSPLPSPSTSPQGPSQDAHHGPQHDGQVGQEACDNLVYPLIANRDSISKWESFEIVSHSEPLWRDLVSLKTYYGRYVSAYPDGFVEAHAMTASLWELFKMDTHEDGRVSFRSTSGNYLKTEHYGAVRAASRAIGAREKFVQAKNADGTTALRSFTGRYISAERTCADEGLGCFEEDRAYSPRDMAGQAATREASAARCQARCAGTMGCEHFTFFPAGLLCHLQGKHSAQPLLSAGAVAGPRACGDLVFLRKDQPQSMGPPGGHAQRIRRLALPLGLSAVLAVTVYVAAALLTARRARCYAFLPTCTDAAGLVPESIAS